LRIINWLSICFIVSKATPTAIRIVVPPNGNCLTPYSDSVWTPSQETTRQAYNNFVKSSASGCDGVIDQDLATRDPANPARMLPANDTGDHLHPNTAGNAAIANSVNLNLFTP